MASKCPAGTVTQACAFRAKYRLVDTSGHVIRARTLVNYLAPNTANRGGVYPAGIRCKQLLQDVLVSGFSKEELNNQVVTVEECPPEELAAVIAAKETAGLSYASAAAYSRSESAKDELLATCFQSPYDKVTLTLLAHNHMVMVCRAVIAGAKWDLTPNVDKGITFCDKDGRLSATAIAATPNGMELQEVLNEGLDCEILSWKMECEVPEAAGIISLALNNASDVAMRTTELTAVAELSGAIIASRRSSALGNTVAFKSVLDQVRHRLDVAAEDPDLGEVFLFLINGGVGTNSYIPDFMQFAQVFVNSKLRQLRFSAFTVINKMCGDAHWSKVAVLKRAYHRKPNNGYCANPEMAWTGFDSESISPLEDALRFMHVECLSSVQAMGKFEANKAVSGFDVMAADTFFKVMTTSKRERNKKIDDVRCELLSVLAAFMDEVKMVQASRQSSSIDWIDLTASAKPGPAVAEAPGVDHVRIMEMDESTGKPKASQVEFEDRDRQGDELKQSSVGLPWRDWIVDNKVLGCVESDKAATVVCMHSIHENFDVVSQQIDVLLTDTRISVVALAAVAEKGLRLPPCIPKQSRVLDASEHPCAVSVLVQVKRPVLDLSEKTQPNIRTSTFFLNPESTHPKPSDEAFEANSSEKWAAAKSAGAAAKKKSATMTSDGHGLQPGLFGRDHQWIWGLGSAETMHPFWAVRRLSHYQMLKEVALLKEKATDDKLLPRFNCKLIGERLTQCSLGVLESKMPTCTRIFDVPFITNICALREGEELIMEVGRGKKAKKDDAKRKRDFRDQLVDDAKDEKSRTKR